MVWYYSGKVPGQFLQSRQINLHKGHKVVDSKISAADVRPISIMSCWWRAFSSAWAKSPQVQGWTNSFLNKEVGHGKDSIGTESLMDILQDKLAANPEVCVASLDWAQAFDTMRPYVTTEVMKRINFAPGLAQLLQSVWTHQIRFLQFENRTRDCVCRPERQCPKTTLLALFVLAFGFPLDLMP